MQTERTYWVTIPEGDFIATLMEDWDSMEIQWDIWDEEGGQVKGRLEAKVIEEIEKLLQ